MKVTFEWEADSQMDAARDAARLAELLPIKPDLRMNAGNGTTVVLVVECSIDAFCDNLMTTPDFDEEEPSPNGERVIEPTSWPSLDAE